MNFEFGPKSKLKGIQISDVVRFSYIPRSKEQGLEEYVLVFNEAKNFPSTISNPELYEGAKVEPNPAEHSTELVYDGLALKVIMITKRDDDLFREECPQIIEDNELFRIDF